MFNQNKNFLKTIALTLLFVGSLNAFDFKSIASLFSKNKTTIDKPVNDVKYFDKLSNFIYKRPKFTVAFSAIALLSIAGFIWYKLNVRKSNEVRKLNEENFINIKKGKIVINYKDLAKKGLNRGNMTKEELLKEVNLKKEELLEKIGINRAKELIETNFIDAYKNNKIDNFMILLEEIDFDRAKELINETGINFKWKLHWLDEKSTLKMVRFLLSLGGNVNEGDGYDGSLLYMACRNDRLDIVKELLNHNDIDPNKRNNNCKKTPLYIACEEGNIEIVKELLSHKDIKPNKLNVYGCTPLCIACKKGNLEIVKELLNHKDIDINKIDKYGNTLLFSAAREYYVVHCKVIKKKDYLEVTKELLKHKDINVNEINLNNQTTLDLLCKSKLLTREAAKLLLENGAYIKSENLINIKNKKILKYLNLANQFDLCMQTGQFFDIPEDEKNNVDLCEFRNRLLTSKRAKDKLKFPKLLNNKRGLSRFSDCRIRTVD